MSHESMPSEKTSAPRNISLISVTLDVSQPRRVLLKASLCQNMARIDVALDVSHLLMSTFQSEKMRKSSEKSLTRLTSQSLGSPMRHVISVP